MGFLGLLLILTAVFVGVAFSSFCKTCKCKHGIPSSVTEASCSNMRDDFFIPARIRKDLRNLMICYSNSSSTFGKTNVLRPTLRHLEMTNCGIIHVEKEALHSFPCLEYINFSDNRIEFLHPETFIGVPFLCTLILAGNNIRLPVNEPFLLAPHVVNLDLSRCHIKELPPVTFNNMPSLKTLNLSNNSIDLLYGDEFENLENLHELNLDYNGLKLINQSTFRNNVRLKNLSLRGNYFLALHNSGFEFFNIPSLEMLWLDDCELRSLPGYSFGGLRNLTFLSANNNILKIIDFGDIRHISKLDTLRALGNSLHCGCMGEYRNLCCSWNELEVIVTCNGTDWEAARNVTCSDDFIFWGYFKPWQWKTAASIAGGCVVMFIISILLMKGPYLRRKFDINIAVEDIYI